MRPALPAQPSRADISAIVRAYDDTVVRAYCWGRFRILHQRFLIEIGQYLPREGHVLDVGCGFGLFSLYYARLRPDLRLLGVDKNEGRIALARRAAERLGLGNVRYEVADARTLTLAAPLDGAYMLDIVHHVPPGAVEPLLRQVHARLGPGGRLVVKDIERHPAYKRLFTLLLDKAMDPKAPVHYWDRPDVLALLERIGFEAVSHSMVDLLPYSHVLYVGRKRA